MSQSVGGDSLFQLYSFAGMPIAGAFTTLSYLDQYWNMTYVLPKIEDEEQE